MISSILLAAGQSKRMNGENKLVKKINGIPLIKYSIKNILTSSIDNIVVVLGYEKEIVEKFIDKSKKIKLVFNKNFESGMASSIKVGLDNLPAMTDSFFICLGDMPNVNSSIYNKLIKSKNNNEIIIPTYKGQRGNPILFSKSIKDELMNLEGDMGAKKIIDIKKEKIFEVETLDKSVTQNFNTRDSFVL
tara:strand:- start:2029 stop:2598 length:570 start_codon:yes stop_codon:yes gene_type:complete